MILTIEAIHETLNFETTAEDHASINVDTSKITDADYLFSKRFIIDIINQRYLDGELSTEWVRNDDWVREYNADHVKYDRSYLPYMKFNLARHSSILGEDKVFEFNTINVSVILITEHEFNMYVERAFKLEYGDTTVHNAVIELPESIQTLYQDLIALNDGTTPFSCDLTSSYVFVHGCSMWDGLSRWKTGEKMYDEFYYVIQKKDLNRPVLKIHAPEVLLAHLIGKKGANINKLKELLHSMGWNKIAKIHLIGVNSETCGEHFE